MKLEIVSTDPVLFTLPKGAGKLGCALSGPLAAGSTGSKSAPTRKWIVTRKEIESLNTRRHLGGLNARLSPALLGSLRNRVILLVDGNDKDPRQLYEIPEVRKYFAKLVRQGMPLLFFAAADYPFALRAIAACIAKRAIVHSTKDGGTVQVLLEGNSLKPFLAADLTQYLFLSARLGHPPHESLENMAGALEALLGPRKKGRKK